MLRGEVAEAQELADRLIADAGDADMLAAASAFERTVKRPERAIAETLATYLEFKRARVPSRTNQTQLPLNSV